MGWIAKIMLRDEGGWGPSQTFLQELGKAELQCAMCMHAGPAGGVESACRGWNRWNGVEEGKCTPREGRVHTHWVKQISLDLPRASDLVWVGGSCLATVILCTAA